MDLQEERERDARLCAEADRVRRLEESHARLLAAAKRAYQFAAVEVPGSTTGLSPSFRNPVVDMLREAIAAAPA